MNNYNKNYKPILETIPYATMPMAKNKIKNKSIQLPSSFSWNDISNIPTSFSNPSKLLYPIFKQHSCGACWAWSVAACISDRYAIAFKTENPKISPSSIISGVYCKMAKNSNVDMYNGCEGGSAFDALILLVDITQSKNPVLCDPSVSNSKDDLRAMFKTMECDNYDWCDLNPRCNSNIFSDSGSQEDIVNHFNNQGNLNDLIPEFTTSCIKHKPSKDFSKTISIVNDQNKFGKYKGTIDLKLKRCYRLEDIDSIKYSLYKYGTVISNFVIYPDFIYKRSSGDLFWEETKYIYMHKKNCQIYDLGNIEENPDILMGYHSVTIVGWGVETFETSKLYSLLKINKPIENKFIDIPYWIGRNTWGDTWNGNGYFKAAMTNKDLGINTVIGMDIPITLHINQCYMPCGTPCDRGDDMCEKTSFGGCCAVDIDVDNTEFNDDPFIDIIQPKTTLTTTFSNNQRYVNNKNNCKYIIVLAILLLSIYLYLRYKKTNTKQTELYLFNNLIIIIILSITFYKYFS